MYVNEKVRDVERRLYRGRLPLLCATLREKKNKCSVRADDIWLQHESSCSANVHAEHEVDTYCTLNV